MAGRSRTRRRRRPRPRPRASHDDRAWYGPRVSSTHITRRIHAPPSQIYQAILDPEAVAIWMVPNGMSSHIHTFEAREGGAFRISLTYDAPAGTGKSSAQTDTFHGRFVTLVQDAKIVEVVEFESPDPRMQGEMTITYELVDLAGETEVVAVHDRLPPGVSPSDNELGWRMSLDKLAVLVETRRDAFVPQPG